MSSVNGPSSFFEEHIYGDVMANDRSLSPALTYGFESRSPSLIDPVVRNKTSSEKFEPPMESKAERQRNPHSRDRSETERPNWHGARIHRPSEKRDTRANVLDESFYSEERNFAREDKLRLSKKLMKGCKEKSPYRKYIPTKFVPELTKSNECEFVPDIPLSMPSIQRLVEENNGHGQYRTILYVVPNSPKGTSPATWDGDMPRGREKTSYKASHFSEEWLARASNEELMETNQISPRSLEEISASRKQANSGPITPLQDGTRITFQGPGRYLEEKPYYQTLPSPRQMEINPIVNGMRNMVNHLNITPVQTPPPLMLKRTDFNQIVVDIKPRDLQESDKQQHVSQWIQVGTLGDTLNSKLEESDSTHDDVDANFVVGPSDYVDLMACPASRAPVSRVKITREDSDDDPIDSASLLLQRSVEEWNGNQYHPTPAYSRRAFFDTIPEESSTPDTTQTASVKSSLHVNVVPGNDNTAKKAYHGKLIGPASICKPKMHEVNKLAESEENHTRDSLSRVIKIDPATAPKDGDLRSTRALTYQSIPDSQSIAYVDTNNKGTKEPPRVAPKPKPTGRLIEFTSKQSDNVPANETHPNKQYRYMHGTFPRTVMNGSKFQRDPLNLEMYTADQTDSPDISDSTVRNLAAYFTDLIKQQSRMRNVEPNSNRDERDGRTSRTGPSPEQETLDERDRRLRAVEELRKRSTPAASFDYSRPSFKSQIAAVSRENSQDDYYPYVRPMSALRPKAQLLHSNIAQTPCALETGSVH